MFNLFSEVNSSAPDVWLVVIWTASEHPDVVSRTRLLAGNLSPL